MRECARHGVADDRRVRQLLAQSWIEVELFRLHNTRTLTRLARGEEIGPQSSLVKLFWANMSQRFYETAVDALAPDVAQEWTLGLLASRANSIMGGTSEIQRDIAGERLLGLPREPR
jgi:alkylation response protein AidB-like acyl-CoA dehydrogenase